MTTDLTCLPAELKQALPSMAEGIARAVRLLQQVHSFEDVERLFLMGAGLSPNTYRAYLTAVRDFYAFTEGLHPLQVLPADVERWYDGMVGRRVDRNTIALRLAGLRKFFAGIRNVVPSYTSPFEIMSENLQAKLRPKQKDAGTKKSLNREEIRKLLTWAKAEQPIGDYAAVFFLLTSGLRAAELLSLNWRDLEYTEGAWTAYFTGKGGKRVQHEIYGPAVEAVRAAFQAMFNRDPLPADALFWTPAQAEGDISRPLRYHTLWHRVRALGAKASEAGIVRGSLQFTPHLFRRSYITGLYRSGMKIKALQKKSRHRSLDVLINHYIDDSEPAAPYLVKMLGVA